MTGALVYPEAFWIARPRRACAANGSRRRAPRGSYSASSGTDAITRASIDRGQLLRHGIELRRARRHRPPDVCAGHAPCTYRDSPSASSPASAICSTLDDRAAERGGIVAARCSAALIASARTRGQAALSSSTCQRHLVHARPARAATSVAEPVEQREVTHPQSRSTDAMTWPVRVLPRVPSRSRSRRTWSPTRRPTTADARDRSRSATTPPSAARSASTASQRRLRRCASARLRRSTARTHTQSAAPRPASTTRRPRRDRDDDVAHHSVSQD